MPRAMPWRVAAARIEAFHARQLPPDDSYVDAQGIRLGLRWRPVAAVGLYVPGGTAAYPSSVLMNAIPARVAGVERMVMVVPTPDGVVNPLVLAAAAIAGVDEIYRIGGAQAVAALAYGTASIAPVDKIVGPGNAYVAEAKRQVFGRVGIDMIAGPSEIVIVAEAVVDPEWVAADLLSQAEHDERAQAILITDDRGFAERVVAAVERQLATLERGAIAPGELAGARCRGRWSRRIEDAAALVDALAPEHLELIGPRRRGAGGLDPPCRRDLPGAVHARGDRRLCRRPEPRAADRPHRPVRLRSRRPRLPQAYHAARLRPGRASRSWRRPLPCWPGPRGCEAHALAVERRLEVPA